MCFNIGIVFLNYKLSSFFNLVKDSSIFKNPVNLLCTGTKSNTLVPLHHYDRQ